MTHHLSAPCSKQQAHIVFRISLLLVLLFGYKEDTAQRKPTPQEAAAITKAAGAVNDIVERFADSNWQMSAGGIAPAEYYSVKIRPNEPINTTPFQGDWDFTIRTGSPLYHEKIQPYIAKISSPPTDPNDKKAWDEYMHSTDKIKGLQHVYVEAVINRLSVFVNPLKGGNDDLKIPGCYFSYKQPGGEVPVIGTDYQLPSYVLAFGNWKNTKKESDGEYMFPFVHKPGTPYIENIVIILSGNEERIKELLQKTDWDKINEGLTL